MLDPDRYPLFADSKSVAEWNRPFAAPFDPHDGDWFLSAGADDQAYKRLLKPFDLTGQAAATFEFFASVDTEPDYDYMFVEIHTVGQDDWTTLEDANGNTSDDVGLSCPSAGDGSNWQSIHPFLAHYQTKNADGSDCTPTGTSGEWNAFTGNSGGWQKWSLPIPAQFLGKQIEVAISVASDPASLGLGAWVDELRMLDAGDAPLDSADPSFESGMDGWTLPGPPGPAGEGQSPVTGWERAQTAPFVETPIVTTTDTVYTGFGFEAITGAASRNALMQAVLTHLGIPFKPVFDAAAPRVEPTPTPTPSPTASPSPSPTATPTPVGRFTELFFKRVQQIGTARRRGVRAVVRCEVRCQLRIDMLVSYAVKRKYRLHSRLIGRRYVNLDETEQRGTRVVFKSWARRGLRRARSLNVQLRAVQLDHRPAIRKNANIRLRR